MKLGLLWYDADPKRPAARKIDDAVERYREKFGAAPNTCYVSPLDSVSHPSLRVVAKPIIQAHHYLVGIAEEPRQAEPDPLALPTTPKRRRATSTLRPGQEQGERGIRRR